MHTCVCVSAVGLHTHTDTHTFMVLIFSCLRSECLQEFCSDAADGDHHVVTVQIKTIF